MYLRKILQLHSPNECFQPVMRQRVTKRLKSASAQLMETRKVWKTDFRPESTVSQRDWPGLDVRALVRPYIFSLHFVAYKFRVVSHHKSFFVYDFIRQRVFVYRAFKHQSVQTLILFPINFWCTQFSSFNNPRGKCFLLYECRMV